MKKYQVIGGQYESCWYGESNTLHGAKIIASKNLEHWDNFKGFHTPNIYLSDDVVEIESKGRITTWDGETIRVPSGEPICYKKGNNWVNFK